MVAFCLNTYGSEDRVLKFAEPAIRGVCEDMKNCGSILGVGSVSVMDIIRH